MKGQKILIYDRAERERWVKAGLVTSTGKEQFVQTKLNKHGISGIDNLRGKVSKSELCP